MRHLTKKLVILGMAAVLAASAGTVSASAKTVTAKKSDFETSLTKAKKKAKTVKKGKTKVIIQKRSNGSVCSGFLKFKAPKTKTYKFTVSDIKGIGAGKGDRFTGFYYLMLKSYTDSITMKEVATKGGKSNTLHVSSKNWNVGTYGDLVNRSLHTRSGKIRLKKGQTVYIYMYFSCPKVSLNLTVK